MENYKVVWINHKNNKLIIDLTPSLIDNTYGTTEKTLSRIESIDNGFSQDKNNERKM